MYFFPNCFSCTAYAGGSGGWEGEPSAFLSFSFIITLVVLGQVTSWGPQGLLWLVFLRNYVALSPSTKQVNHKFSFLKQYHYSFLILHDHLTHTHKIISSCAVRIFVPAYQVFFPHLASPSIISVINLSIMHRAMLSNTSNSVILRHYPSLWPDENSGAYFDARGTTHFFHQIM